jgi:hypothetical protein
MGDDQLFWRRYREGRSIGRLVPASLVSLTEVSRMRAALVSFAAGVIRPGIHAALALVAALALNPAHAGAQAEFTYTVIERLPVTTGTASHPSINAAGQVAFAVDGKVRRGDGGVPVIIYDRPLGEGRADGDLSINAAGAVAFFTAGGLGISKIWVGDGNGPANAFAVSQTPWAIGRSPSINDAGQVVFEASQGGTTYLVTGNAFTVIAGPSDPIPGGTLLRVATPLINNAGQFAFSALVSQGGFRVLRNTNGLVEIAGQIQTTGGYTFGMNDAGVVASYRAEQRAIVTSDNRTIATNDTGFTLHTNVAAINDAGVVAFMAVTGTGTIQVLVGDGTFRREVLKVGDVVPGLGVVRQVTINNFAINDSGQVAMLVVYDDGGTDRLAIVRADPAHDTTDPQIDVPDNIVVVATGPDGAAVDFTVVATDDSDPHPVVECAPASGSTFPVGTTIVTCTATDASGNDVSASFEVTVVDATGPALIVPGALIAEATSALGAVVNFTATASDPGYPDPVVTCDLASGATFPLGTTIVTCRASDAAGNESSASFTVTVRDTTAPGLTVPQGLVLDAFSTRQLSYTVTATDAVDPSPVISCTPPPGSSVSVGIDVVVTCTATDAFGNAASASFTVEVLSLSDLLLRMIRAIEAMDLDDGLKRTLIMHLQSAVATLGNVTAPPFHRSACPHLNVFRAQLSAALHTGAMTETAGAPLMQGATNVWSFLGCVHGFVPR